MTAMKNATHLGILGIWATLGILFSLQHLAGFALVTPLAFWLWFAGFAAVTTAMVTRFKGPLAALAIHAGAFGVLHLIPRVFPLDLLRLGLDLLSGR